MSVRRVRSDPTRARSRRVRSAFVITISAGLLAACGTTPAPSTVGPAPTESELSTAEAEIVALLAQSREDAGLPDLTRDVDMDTVARAWAQQLAGSGELEHNPSYANEIPGGWTVSGENVGWIEAGNRSITELPTAVHEAWLDSPSHRANIEDVTYTTVGVGIAYDPVHGYYVTQDFAAYPS